jgi:hypothetical protein
MFSEENSRRRKRSTSVPSELTLSRPAYWALDDGFNPYLTRSRVDRIGHSIRAAMRDRTYMPRHPVVYQVAKPSGGWRNVSIYQVADGAVSKMLFEGILKKNLPLLSARAYAYRKDISAQDAIQYVKSEFRGRTRLYVAEYDFRSFFDTIDHDHIRRVLHDHFLLTEVERAAIDAFLSVDGISHGEYKASGGPLRKQGIPQGTSISLFLANVAAWELDRKLESVGVGFCRYADDTLIWATDYSQIVRAVEFLHEQAEAIGVSVNVEKSPGIRLLVAEGGSAEMVHTESVDYLGYRLFLDRAEMKEATLAAIKDRVSQLIYWGLIYEPEAGTQDLSRLRGNVDQDYASVIWRIRRYLYGDLSEKAVRRYQHRDAPLRRFKGLMSAYPLLDDTSVLQELDEWVLTQIWLSVRKRGRLLTQAGMLHLPPPHGKTRDELRSLTTIGTASRQRIDLSVPSVRRIARVITSAAALHGPSLVGRARPYDYS